MVQYPGVAKGLYVASSSGLYDLCNVFLGCTSSGYVKNMVYAFILSFITAILIEYLSLFAIRVMLGFPIMFSLTLLINFLF